MLRRFALLLLAFPVWCWSAPSPALATIVEGEAFLTRDTTRHALAEGIGVLAGDIVETTSAAGIVRIEFESGAVVDLGPDTRVLVTPRFQAERRQRPTLLYLLQGWTKSTLPASLMGSGVASSAVDVVIAAGSGVEHVATDGVRLFVESGQAGVTEAAGGRAALSRAVKGGEFYRLAAGKGVVAPRPAPEFLASIPRAFRDTLPQRADRFKGQERAPKALAEVRYGDIQPWLEAEPAVRLALLPRWRKLASRPDFRTALIANLGRHPEWGPVLFPPKPKEPAAVEAEAHRSTPTR